MVYFLEDNVLQLLGYFLQRVKLIQLHVLLSMQLYEDFVDKRPFPSRRIFKIEFKTENPFLFNLHCLIEQKRFQLNQNLDWTMKQRQSEHRLNHPIEINYRMYSIRFYYFLLKCIGIIVKLLQLDLQIVNRDKVRSRSEVHIESMHPLIYELLFDNWENLRLKDFYRNHYRKNKLNILFFFSILKSSSTLIRFDRLSFRLNFDQQKEHLDTAKYSICHQQYQLTSHFYHSIENCRYSCLN